MVAAQPSVIQSLSPHPHIAGEHCPWCDQPIPHEKFEEIRARIEAKERLRSTEMERRLRESFSTEKAQVELKAKADLDRAQKESAALVERLMQEAEAKATASREAGKIAAEAAMQEQLLELQRAKQQTDDDLSALKEGHAAEIARRLAEQRQAAETTAAEALAAERSKAQQERQALEEKLQGAQAAKLELERLRDESTAQLAELTESAAAKEAAAREEEKRIAEAAVAEAVASERSKAQQQNQALEEKLQGELAVKQELERQRDDAAARLAELTETATAKETAAREEGKRIAELAAASNFAAAQEAQRIAENQLRELKTGQEAELNTRLQEQREALEKAKTEAVNAERSQAFDDKLKLEGKLQELQRQIQNKTAVELGEGAEVDLFEVLKAEFPDDRITRVAKGASGPDIIHEVLHNGKSCGSIIYDCKNRSAWRHEYAAKLRQDQLAAKADHAVLATSVFPAGARQLHVQDGVILINPARAIVLGQMLRKQVVQVHTLRLSNEARDQKTAQLYAFITSERCAQLLDRMKTVTDDMTDLEVKELKAHEATWKRRGELIRSVQRSHADFSLEIDRIIGTADIEQQR